MSKLGEIVYMINDEIKLFSDDSSFTEDHIIFLIEKYRSAILRQEYNNIKKEVPISNYQEICLDLIQADILNGIPCEGTILRSREKVPDRLNIGSIRVYPVKSFLHDHIIFVTPERMIFTGHNKALSNFIYCTIAPDNYLYLRSANPQFLYMEMVSMSAVFQDALAELHYSCNGENEDCTDRLEMEFPMEDNLVPILIQAVVKELLGAAYRPADQLNSANDETNDLARFIGLNSKSALAKQLEG